MATAAPGQLNLDDYPSWGSRGVDCFEKLEQIGEGTYGYAPIVPSIPRNAYASVWFGCVVFVVARQVFMAKETETKEIVALKKIRMDNEREGVSILPRLSFFPK
jgi:cyclin-dependent kinase 12/13